jgi:hypothetical protein
MLIVGYLTSALKYFEAALRTADATVYNTSFIRAAIPLYTAVATNIQSPLLEFDSAAYKEAYSGIFDFEFYKYVTMDFDFEYKNTSFAKHLKAKRYMKNHKYYDAINILLELENEKITLVCKRLDTICTLYLNGEKIGAKDLLNTILVSGFQHHFPVVIGDYTAEIKEFAAWAGLTPIKKVEYADYLQVIE